VQCGELKTKLNTIAIAGQQHGTYSDEDSLALDVDVSDGKLVRQRHDCELLWEEEIKGWRGCR
jgi:hypothetical protein